MTTLVQRFRKAGTDSSDEAADELSRKVGAAHQKPPMSPGEVLLGEDWVNPEAIPNDQREARSRSRVLGLNRSPLARKIIIFNLIALLILVTGVLFLNPFRASLMSSHQAALEREVRLLGDLLESAANPQPPGAPRLEFSITSNNPSPTDYYTAMLGALSPTQGNEVFLYDRQGHLLASRGREALPQSADQGGTTITTFLNNVWEGVALLFSFGREKHEGSDRAELLARSTAASQTGEVQALYGKDAAGGTYLVASAPIYHNGEVMAVLTLATTGGALDYMVRKEREKILQVFLVAVVVSITLSLLLASTISNPLADLAAAAEIGRDRDGGKVSTARVRIPDLAARPDEIGRLSVAMRGMVSALYDRIDANEQFAADVAHEIKNPLASLRSAVGSLRFVKKDEHREKLLDVIEHDVRRLDRLVSDISNASRLDSELVKEEEEEFDLIHTLANLTTYLGQQAVEDGIDFLTDLPHEEVMIRGLEARLAQVFVNLISNAVSFCEEGDAVRIWARRRENRVLVVVEDTGPGIPEQALVKIFKRFYSDRPETHFGNNSGLGLSISKQIVEAHGGVIWAENIRMPDADPDSKPLGARFVVGLPV